MRSFKRRLTEQQEFEIMKLVLDKFLWLGFVVMGFGLFSIFNESTLTPGIWYILIGAAVLILFVVLVWKEYEVLK